ncbi:hypothetical protein AMTRI_Chr03g52880 [Amborella trichopoda]
MGWKPAKQSFEQKLPTTFPAKESFMQKLPWNFPSLQVQSIPFQLQSVVKSLPSIHLPNSIQCVLLKSKEPTSPKTQFLLLLIRIEASISQKTQILLFLRTEPISQKTTNVYSEGRGRWVGE